MLRTAWDGPFVSIEGGHFKASKSPISAKRSKGRGIKSLSKGVGPGAATAEFSFGGRHQSAIGRTALPGLQRPLERGTLGCAPRRVIPEESRAGAVADPSSLRRPGAGASVADERRRTANPPHTRRRSPIRPTPDTPLSWSLLLTTPRCANQASQNASRPSVGAELSRSALPASYNCQNSTEPTLQSIAPFDLIVRPGPSQ